jgi:hypothetical protein
MPSFASMSSLARLVLADNPGFGGNLSATDWAAMPAVAAGNQTLALNFSGCGLRGTLPSEWASFPNFKLAVLDVSINNLTGSLPKVWASLSPAVSIFLNVSGNQLRQVIGVLVSSSVSFLPVKVLLG